ncbi:hypothetical protein ISF6_1795 [Piscinibacter sakaiensis]|uniref:Uncharacterized protein n=1 Tax=Piscinibacter sakaiensis TaxID=1547922 RepID=A0A0K8P1A9_PISS1|nr:hypothetical protein ISF6_1795 [Piscinibacter sakaiensis]
MPPDRRARGLPRRAPVPAQPPWRRADRGRQRLRPAGAAAPRRGRARCAAADGRRRAGGRARAGRGAHLRHPLAAAAPGPLPRRPSRCAGPPACPDPALPVRRHALRRRDPRRQRALARHHRPPPDGRGRAAGLRAGAGRRPPLLRRGRLGRADAAAPEHAPARLARVVRRPGPAGGRRHGRPAHGAAVDAGRGRGARPGHRAAAALPDR